MSDGVIDKDIVRHVAKLARLSLTGDEIGRFSGQLSVILEYVNKLNELDVADTEPMSHAVRDVKDVFRKDEVRESLTAAEALKSAPKRIRDFFGVPKIIE
ncbi:MAG: Asp-tRNA(Asn)/Glu-tRNA(Gln) amidotransferase subunit GatC [Candidatus Omnitrophota bacterium]